MLPKKELIGETVFVITNWHSVKAVFITKKCAERFVERRGNKEYLKISECRISELIKDCQI